MSRQEAPEQNNPFEPLKAAGWKDSQISILNKIKAEVIRGERGESTLEFSRLYFIRSLYLKGELREFES